ncbi:Uncharacterized protein dnm_059740 [Desulfonema magnum]|uniref:Uncharacterized protein n=1 Tax=Desulfonema magnum TaxID=45655 RepID=A0A975BQX2_9BACT|nr:Uncharacterized protein dnm_059740 [Desulfonema magnum]
MARPPLLFFGKNQIYADGNIPKPASFTKAENWQMENAPKPFQSAAFLTPCATFFNRGYHGQTTATKTRGHKDTQRAIAGLRAFVSLWHYKLHIAFFIFFNIT